jgi:predicted GNAT family acetyltransferase
MFQISRGSEVLGAAFFLNKNLLLSGDFDGATGFLAQHLKESGIQIPSVLGPVRETDAFAKAWSGAAGCEATLVCIQGLYRLTEVRPPAGVPGQMRTSLVDEKDLICGWHHAFREEAIRYEPFDPIELRASTEKRIRQEMTFVWETDGLPVATASLTRPSKRGITVNAVYTPPELRRRGYGSALVAAVSQSGLSRGKDFCVLYTDLANPTANSIYKKVGYTLVSRLHNYRFRY